MKDKKLQISSSVLLKILSEFPAPDDIGPFGPGGPVMQEINWRLRPPPYPWRTSGVMDALRMLGLEFPNPEDNPPIGPGSPVITPSPEPWRVLNTTRSFIQTVIAAEGLAILLPRTDVSKQIAAATKQRIAEFVDDYCGTGIPHWHLPPHPLPDPEPRPIYRVLGAIEFYKASQLVGVEELSKQFDAAAHKLLEAGLEQVRSTQAA